MQAELQAMLTGKGLPKSGTKHELALRLLTSSKPSAPDGNSVIPSLVDDPQDNVYIVYSIYVIELLSLWIIVMDHVWRGVREWRGLQ